MKQAQADQFPCKNVVLATFSACKNSIVSVLDESEGPYTAGHQAQYTYLMNSE